jgi:hypothetical protein
VKEKLFMRESKSNGICIIRLNGGRRLELKGADVPSVSAVVAVLKARKRKRELGALNCRDRMRRDLMQRLQASMTN